MGREWADPAALAGVRRAGVSRGSWPGRRSSAAARTRCFLQFNAGKSDYADKRYGDEAKRLYGVLDQRLVGWEYLAGDYSVADIATWPWISRWPWHRIDWADYPYLKRWFVAIASRPAVQKGWMIPFDAGGIPLPD